MADWSQVARRIRVPLGFAFAAVYIWLARPAWMSLAIGLIVALPGLLLRALASGHVRKNEALATTGPYAYTRNPLYLGSLILATGFAIAARSWWIDGIMAIFFVLVYVPVIRGEEVFLRGRFPEFEEYARAVPRLLPRITALGNNSSQFSRELYLKHREYHALIGAASMAAALTAKLIWRP